MASPRTRIELYFTARFETEPRDVAFVPGRLVVLGEHLDHQGGVVLATPLVEGVYVAWGIRPDRRVVVHALNARETDTFEGDRPVPGGRRWSDLVRGLFASLAKAGHRIPGLNLAIFGDLPVGAGLASSAAYLCAVHRALDGVRGEETPPLGVARTIAAVEREWGGVGCGLMDPVVVLSGRPDRILAFDALTGATETLAIPEDVRFEPVPTGVTRRLDQTPYDRRRGELARALARVRSARADLERLVDLVPEDLPLLEGVLPEPLFRRTRHVVTETARVRAGRAALEAGDAEGLGALLVEAHASLRDDYEASTPEIDAQVEAQIGEPGVLGARLQGAGWGGSLVVLRRPI